MSFYPHLFQFEYDNNGYLPCMCVRYSAIDSHEKQHLWLCNFFIYFQKKIQNHM